ncbi:MAG: DUF1761 domain-containing protein, partial [Parcubacteria group bacterium]
AMGVGFLWYGVLFRKPWMDMMGLTMESMGQMKMSANKAYILQFIASLVMACILSRAIFVLSAYMEIGGWMVGVKAGFYMWLGFIAPVTLGVVLWENKPWKLWFINASNYLVTLVIMGIILSLWV